MQICNLRELVWIRRKLVWMSVKLVWILIDLVRHMLTISEPGEPWWSGSGGDAVEAACFLVRKHEETQSGGEGGVRLLTATPPSPPPGNEPGPGGEVPNLGDKRGG